MTALSLLCPRSPRRQAPRALRERLECSEGGDTGRRARRPCRISALVLFGKPVTTFPEQALMRPSVQPPAGVERNGALYAAGGERQGYRGRANSGPAGG